VPKAVPTYLGTGIWRTKVCQQRRFGTPVGTPRCANGLLWVAWHTRWHTCQATAMTDWDRLRADLKAHYRAAAKVAHPDAGGSGDDMATVNAAFDEAMKGIARREQEELAQTQEQPNACNNGDGSWENQFSDVPEPPAEPKQYPDTVKGRVHKLYDEQGLAPAIKLARSLGVKPQRFKRWRKDFEFSAEWE
jgi:hypothetical protein